MTLSDFERAANAMRKSVAVGSEGGPVQGVQLVEALKRRMHKEAQTRRFTAGTGCALLLVGVLVAVRQHQPRILSYQVGTSKERGVLGDYVSAPTGKSLELHFSEGSQIVLESRTRVRVTGTTSHGAMMTLEDGRARADIVHRKGADWRILAGPYVVGVTGTSFDVGYDVKTQTFELKMHSGIVKVLGPGLGSPVEVRDTQSFVLSANAAESAKESNNTVVHPERDPNIDSTHPPTADALAANAVLSGPTRSFGNKSVASQVSSASAAAAANSPASESWARLGARGQHRRIVELVERQGLESATATASGPDLFALGNAARFTGKPGLAVKAYQAVRQRFSNSEEASGAAFFLGRLSESSDPTRAMGWYERYVAEAPKGAWVADALGRHLVLLNGTQGAVLAQGAAKNYLGRFPNGPYAGFARTILGP